MERLSYDLSTHTDMIIDNEQHKELCQVPCELWSYIGMGLCQQLRLRDTYSPSLSKGCIAIDDRSIVEYGSILCQEG